MTPAGIQLREVAATHRTDGVALEELEMENLSSGGFHLGEREMSRVNPQHGLARPRTQVQRTQCAN